MEVIKEIKKIYDQIVDIRRHLHMFPELSEQEQETASYICTILKRHQISYQSGIGGHGIIAWIGGHAGHCVGLRADMDALAVTEETNLPYQSKTPGVMHACGHDMHTAILLGVAILLKSKEKEFSGCVKLFFQAAEETVGGAKDMIESGGLENPKVSQMLALHADPSYPAGSIAIKYGAMNAAAEEFDLLIKGKACHGAHPESGVDAVIIASQTVTALQTISSRFTAPATPIVITIGQIHGGTQNNVVCGNVTLSGTVRALNSTVMNQIKTLLPQISDGIAASLGGSAEVRWYGDMYPPLINDDNLTRLLEEIGCEILGREKVYIMQEASLGADDFAYFANAVPSTYFNLGVTAAGQDFHPLHSEKFAPEERAMAVGMHVLIQAVLTLLKQ